MNSYVVRGIVLKRINVGEADRIITIYTEDRGKIRVLGKGLRKLSSRRSGSLEIFNLVKVRLVHGRTFELIAEAEAENAFQILRRDLPTVGVAYQMVEVVDRLSAEGHENREVFGLLVAGLEKVDREGVAGEMTLAEFAVGVLMALGFWPRDRSFEGDWKRFVESVAEYPLRSPRILTRLGDSLQSKE